MQVCRSSEYFLLSMKTAGLSSRTSLLAMLHWHTGSNIIQSSSAKACPYENLQTVIEMCILYFIDRTDLRVGIRTNWVPRCHVEIDGWKTSGYAWGSCRNNARPRQDKKELNVVLILLLTFVVPSKLDLKQLCHNWSCACALPGHSLLRQWAAHPALRLLT